MQVSQRGIGASRGVSRLRFGGESGVGDHGRGECDVCGRREKAYVWLRRSRYAGARGEEAIEEVIAAGVWSQCKLDTVWLVVSHTLAALEVGFGMVGELVRRLLGRPALLVPWSCAHSFECSGSRMSIGMCGGVQRLGARSWRCEFRHGRDSCAEVLVWGSRCKVGRARVEARFHVAGDGITTWPQRLSQAALQRM